MFVFSLYGKNVEHHFNFQQNSNPNQQLEKAPTHGGVVASMSASQLGVGELQIYLWKWIKN